VVVSFSRPWPYRVRVGVGGETAGRVHRGGRSLLGAGGWPGSPGVAGPRCCPGPAVRLAGEISSFRAYLLLAVRGQFFRARKVWTKQTCGSPAEALIFGVLLSGPCPTALGWCCFGNGGQRPGVEWWPDGRRHGAGAGFVLHPDPCRTGCSSSRAVVSWAAGVPGLRPGLEHHRPWAPAPAGGRWPREGRSSSLTIRRSVFGRGAAGLRGYRRRFVTSPRRWPAWARYISYRGAVGPRWRFVGYVPSCSVGGAAAAGASPDMVVRNPTRSPRLVRLARPGGGRFSVAGTGPRPVRISDRKTADGGTPDG